ncbi:MAG TPA: amidohydrolase family protein [Acidimicrobiales bacterium]|nr:amidohydrolase family protein [Acidimicrobiales bacterium]
MFDVIIKGGQLVDGTGGQRRAADVGVIGGRIVEMGKLEGTARRTIDADGRIVAPGFIDVHTHLDVQGFWDPTLSPSPLHGVTTVLGGNCGFTVAPLTDDAAGYLMRMLARVEAMPLTSLEKGVPWDWHTTQEYLDRLDGTLSVNAGFMVGHSAIRRVVMGEAATERHASPEELPQMKALLREGLAAGGLGFSSTLAATHNDAEGRPVPSRHADAAEFIGLAAVCREFEGTSLEFLPIATGPFTDELSDLMIAMSAAAERPLNWNIIAVSAGSLPFWQKKLDVGTRARPEGAKVVGLVITSSPQARMNFRSGFLLDQLPGWIGPMTRPPAEKLRLLRDPAERHRLGQLAAEDSPMRHLADWATKVIVETFTPETKAYEGRTVGDIAREEGRDPFDVLCDIACADDLFTTFVNGRPPDTEEDWQARAQVWQDERAVIGASDAGAHLDMLSTFNYTSVLLEEGVRNHQLLSLEAAIRLITDVPARLYGLRDRGRLAEGAAADVVILDEDTVASAPVHTRTDLPGGAARLYAGAIGIDHVLVNGVEIVGGGSLTDARPGTLLRSGRDTYTPALN